MCPDRTLSGQHFEHGLERLFREGGNVPALWTRARGQQTRLIGLTWIEERQAILVRADSDLETCRRPQGSTVGRPFTAIGERWTFGGPWPCTGSPVRCRSPGLTLDDATFVDVVSSWGDQGSGRSPTAVGPRTRGPHGQEGSTRSTSRGPWGSRRASGSEPESWSTSTPYPDRRVRVNNGTPRPITVHQRLLDERPDLVARFLSVLLRASDWAAEHPSDLYAILQGETGAGNTRGRPVRIDRTSTAASTRAWRPIGCNCSCSRRTSSCATGSSSRTSTSRRGQIRRPWKRHSISLEYQTEDERGWRAMSWSAIASRSSPM